MLGVEGTGCLPERKRRTGIEPASSPWKGEALPLSYHRACEPSPAPGSPTMTVCTNHVALCNLVEDRLPAAITDAFGNVEPLVGKMVELEDQRIGLAAIDARVLAEELEQAHGSFLCECPLADLGVGDIARSMGRVVLLLVGGTAGTTVVVALACGYAAPGEVGEGLGLAAAAAGP